MPLIKDIEHVQIAGGPHLACHWPRSGGIWRWGDELLVGFVEAECDYTHLSLVDHSPQNFGSRSYQRLRRSLDGGKTWTDGAKLMPHDLPVEEQRKILHMDDYQKDSVWDFRGPARQDIDMTSDDAMLIMGRAYCGTPRKKPDGSTLCDQVAYCYRSADRGHTLEIVPGIVWPHYTRMVVEWASNYMVLDSGRLLCWMLGYGDPAGDKVAWPRRYCNQLFASDDNGANWDFYSEIYANETRLAASYPHVVMLPSGRWMCCLGMWFQCNEGVRTRFTSICYSDDKGMNWTEPRQIHSWSTSPYPLVTNDGRVVIIYMRRAPSPTGMYAIVSGDEGQTWSDSFCLNDDTPDAQPLGFTDGGYPVAIEMEDGRILVVYYWQHDDPDIAWHGGRRVIMGTFFKVG